ncbi:MAG TPA: serine hydrolase domain-containing protein [Thermoanaerobaculia bacterium]|nr:serine hydrolase domain-containing protein [Thermoanaerobaculia bacterium]
MSRITGWITAAAVGGLLVAGRCLAQEAPATPAKRLSDSELVAALEAHVKERVAADEFSGVVLLAKNGKPLFRQAYGMAELSFQVPNRPDTKFNIGSISKLFTRLVIDQLAEQGKLALDDTVGKHLPDYPSAEVREKVTIRHLLEHRSGLGDIFTPKFRQGAKEGIRAVRDFLPLFVDDPLEFEPGTDEQYSNAGYIVLGAILEAVTGKDYYDIVRERVFEPAGMTNTGSWERDLPIANRAVGYTRRMPLGSEVAGGLRSTQFLDFYKGSPAGGAFSTVDDLLRLDASLRSGKLFKDGRKTGGFALAGGVPGANAALEQLPGGYTLVVLANYDPPAAVEIGGKVREWLGLGGERKGMKRVIQ